MILQSDGAGVEESAAKLLSPSSHPPSPPLLLLLLLLLQQPASSPSSYFLQPGEGFPDTSQEKNSDEVNTGDMIRVWMLDVDDAGHDHDCLVSWSAHGETPTDLTLASGWNAVKI